MPLDTTTVAGAKLIADELGKVKGIGKVHDHPRWTILRDQNLQLFHSLPDEGLNSSHVDHLTGSEEELPARFRYRGRTGYVIRSIKTFNEEKNSFHEFWNLMDRIRDQFRQNLGVFGTIDIAPRHIQNWTVDVAFHGQTMVHTGEQFLEREMIRNVDVVPA